MATDGVSNACETVDPENHSSSFLNMLSENASSFDLLMNNEEFKIPKRYVKNCYAFFEVLKGQLISSEMKISSLQGKIELLSTQLVTQLQLNRDVGVLPSQVTRGDDLHSSPVYSAPHHVSSSKEVLPRSYSMVVSSTSANSNQEQLTSLIKTSIQPSKLGVGVRSCRPTGDRSILIECGAHRDLEILRDSLLSSPGAVAVNLNVRVNQQQTPRIIIFNIPSSISSEQVIEDFVHQNGITDYADKPVKFTVYVIQIHGTSASYKRCASIAGKFGSPTMLFTCAEGKGFEGQRVHIEDHLQKDGLFEICEVEVQVEKDNGYDCGRPDREPYSITKEPEDDAVEYDCITGYKLKGSSTRFCENTGQWSGEAPDCIPIICDTLESLENGVLKLSVTNEDTPLEGTTAIYKCREGYKLEGDFTRLCLEDGSWSGSKPHCEAIRCPVLASRNQVEVFRLLNKTTRMGSMAELRCRRGSKREGVDYYIYCTEDGEWTKTKSSCILPAGASMPMNEEPRIAKRGGVIFGMVVAVLMMLIVAISFVIIKRRRDANKPELPKRQYQEPVPPPRPPPRAKGIRSTIMDFMQRESPAPRYETLDAEAAVERPAWKTRSLPLEPGVDISNEASARRALSYDGAAGKALNKKDVAGMQRESGVYETVPEENESQNENNKDASSEGRDTPSQRSEGRGTPSQRSEGRGTPSQRSEGRGTPSQKAEGKATPPQKAQRKGTPSQKGRSTPSQKDEGRGTPSQKDEGRGTPSQIGSGDYAAVDYEKKRQSRLMKEQSSEEAIPSTSPVMEDIPLRELPPIPTEETDSEAMPNAETAENDSGKKEQDEEDGGSEESEDVSLPIVQSDSPTSGNATPSPDVVIENQVDGIPESSTPEERTGRRARGRPADQTPTEEAPEGRRTRRVRGREETEEPERSAPTPAAEERPARRRPFGAERFEPTSTTSQPTGRRRF